MKESYPIGKFLFEVEFDYQKNRAEYYEFSLPDHKGYIDLVTGVSNFPSLPGNADPTYKEAIEKLGEKLKRRFSKG